MTRAAVEKYLKKMVHVSVLLLLVVVLEQAEARRLGMLLQCALLGEYGSVHPYRLGS